MSGTSSEIVVCAAMPSRQDVQVRIRKRIRSRLDELGMTARELARAVGHDDAWISGILAGAHGLHWKDFDGVAHKLGLSPSELVRHDDSEIRELTPSEMRLLRHYQTWPRDMQERWLALLDFFSAQIPDRGTAEVLDLVRSLPPSFRNPVLGWFSRCLRTGSIPLEEIVAGGANGLIASRGAPDKERRDPVD
jgi:transcriptional regulator with XRE-family HTH domain